MNMQINVKLIYLQDILYIAVLLLVFGFGPIKNIILYLSNYFTKNA